MSTIEVNTIDSVSGTSNLTIGSSNSSQITLKSGATLTNFPDNTPAFMAKMSASQNISNDTETVIQFAAEEFDTNNNFNTSNYRFTPTESGKYVFVLSTRLNTEADSENHYVGIRKNGTRILTKYFSIHYYDVTQATTVRDMNGSSDYIDFVIYHTVGSTTVLDDGFNETYAFGYKLIGA
jgi:hypothetical protein